MNASLTERIRSGAILWTSVVLCVFTLSEVNYPLLSPHSQLACFAMLGLVICFLHFPVGKRFADNTPLRWLDFGLAALTIACCGYVILHTEPSFENLWTGGLSLGNRAGQETPLDFAVGVVGLLLVLEATRRSIGLVLPILSLVFLLYAYFGASLPDALFPHRGYDFERIVAQTFLHSQGVFSTALKVMFSYVFLFVIFGSFLKSTGATQFIIDFAQRAFGKRTGGPAKVAVVASGLMGSLSGSAVANTATTGTFTIPMMRNSGFERHIAGGIAAAASSGGALVPPIMGAGAYMMLEIIDPPVTFLQIMRAAIIPALLYYFSLLLIVDLYSRRVGTSAVAETKPGKIWEYEGAIFSMALGSLILFLVIGRSPFRAVSLSLLLSLVLAAFNRRTRVTVKNALAAMRDAATNGVSLVAAAASVGIILGVVTLTGLGTKFPSMVLDVSRENLFLALLLIMLSSIVLGMGLPSAVCYLLMATIIGPVLSQLDVIPLAAHLFIFYFGMMSMVTPPVALAAYTASSISKSGMMETSLASFRFALVGFGLPFMFVFRPQLLMMDAKGDPAGLLEIVPAVVMAVLGVIPLAASISGYLFRKLSLIERALLLGSAALILFPGSGIEIGTFETSWGSLVGLVALVAISALVQRSARRAV